jgi:triphosphoribosyl-dephospho-CoA synthase
VSPARPARARPAASLVASRRIGRAALAALHEELTTAPKPGLVSPGDPGAHHDMDAATFFSSLLSLRGFFGAAAAAGASGAPPATLRALGLEAEGRMLRATRGVNTHRGALFSLGLLAAAAGRLDAAGQAPTPPALQATVRDALGPALRRELPRSPGSHGSEAARRHGAGGAREEAWLGFPHLFGTGLPALHRSLARGAPRRAAVIQALLALLAVVPDTNLLHRGGAEGLDFVRGEASGLLEAGGVHREGWEAAVGALHRALVARRLSPGGSADLLAATLFVDRLAGAPFAAEVP